MYTENSETELALLKKMWQGEPVICPKCHNCQLTLLHSKAKKSDCEWQCTQCGEIFRTIKMLKEINE